MKEKNRPLSGFWLACCALFLHSETNAAICSNTEGVKDVPYNFANQTIGSAGNKVGVKTTVSVRSGEVGVSVKCERNRDNVTYRSYLTDLKVTSEEGELKYVSLNEYFDGALQITDSVAGTFYPPVKYVRMGMSDAVGDGRSFPVRDSNIKLTLKVKRRLVGEIVIPRRKAFLVYVTTTNKDPLTRVVYTISYGGNIFVPQSCIIDTGHLVNFDFGEISAGAFSGLAPGERPNKLLPITRNISIKCNNMEANALLSMRLTGTSVSGHALVSDNPDLGFVVADVNEKPLTPNTVDNVLPVRLDSQGEAKAALKAWPVSITGNRPKKGPFSSTGILQFDFD